MSVIHIKSLDASLLAATARSPGADESEHMRPVRAIFKVIIALWVLWIQALFGAKLDSLG